MASVDVVDRLVLGRSQRHLVLSTIDDGAVADEAIEAVLDSIFGAALP